MMGGTFEFEHVTIGKKVESPRMPARASPAPPARSWKTLKAIQTLGHPWRDDDCVAYGGGAGLMAAAEEFMRRRIGHTGAVGGRGSMWTRLRWTWQFMLNVKEAPAAREITMGDVRG